MACHRPIPLRFKWPRTAIAAVLASCLTRILFLPGAVHALDASKRITQYMHTSWRTQDGSAPAGMYAIAQTSDGFLWFLSSRGDLYRFDGVQFRPFRKPADAESIGKIVNIVGDHTGGLWALGTDGITHLRGGVSTGHVALGGLNPSPLNTSEDSDGSIGVVRGGNDVSEPLCHVTENKLKCFGKTDGIPISPIDAILAHGKGGFWLGGTPYSHTGMLGLRRCIRSEA